MKKPNKAKVALRLSLDNALYIQLFNEAGLQDKPIPTIVREAIELYLMIKKDNRQRLQDFLR